MAKLYTPCWQVSPNTPIRTGERSAANARHVLSRWVDNAYSRGGVRPRAHPVKIAVAVERAMSGQRVQVLQYEFWVEEIDDG